MWVREGDAGHGPDRLCSYHTVPECKQSSQSIRLAPECVAPLQTTAPIGTAHNVECAHHADVAPACAAENSCTRVMRASAAVHAVAETRWGRFQQRVYGRF